MKVLNPQQLGYNPLKMKVVGSHGFNWWILPESNVAATVAPSNWWLQDEFSFGMAYFQAVC